MRKSMIFAAAVAILSLAVPGNAPAAFTISHLSTESSTSLAGAHPDFTIDIRFPELSKDGGVNVIADGNVRRVSVGFPPGLLGNPSSVPQCSQAQFAVTQCPVESVVGIATARVTVSASESSASDLGFPIVNLQPRNPDTTAELGFFAVAFPIHLLTSARTDDDFGLDGDVFAVPSAVSVLGVRLEIWGVPGDVAHESERLDPTRCSLGCAPAPPGPYPRSPFFTNPTACGGGFTTRVSASSYQEPAILHEASATGAPITGCEQVAFDPELEARPTTNRADSPSGLDVDITLPQDEEPDELATSHLRKTAVTLPEGLTINSSAANGLSGCSPEQIGLTLAGNGAPRFDKEPAECPPSSAIGTTEVSTPLFDDALHGRIYLATPRQNPFGSLLALYATVKGHGLNIKLAGEVHADPQTGRLTTTFSENPQLPVEHFRLHLFKGAFAPLKTPPGCGKYTTTSSLTPWSAPQSGPPATPSDTYAINQAAGGQPCGAAKNAPSFEAGVADPTAGAYSPFVLNLSRQDGSQGFGDISVTLPPGLLAKLAGTPPCSDAALAAAAGKTGAAEQASPSCPAASRIGSVQVAAGAGPQPFHAPGSVYLAGPYKGAPLSLAIVTPAVAGPFDLGTVVVRNAVRLDPVTAQVSAVSDPIPSILQGIPLDIRSVSLRLDKPQFTRTPTSCDPMQVSGSLTSLLGQPASLTDRFQVGDCPRLGFKPRLALTVLGGFARNAHPALRAVLRSGRHGANLAAATITLPSGELLDLRNVDALCPSSLPPERCPPDSRLGKASVWSPLLDSPMRGPIYLRQPAKRYPDLLADLRGPNGLRFFLRGGFGATAGRVGVRFSKMPDFPLEKAVLTVAGGRRGILVNSRSLCAPRRGLATFVSQDNRHKKQRPELRLKGRC
jgi:hypothetical protein